jgi:hypothetical protein
VGHLALECPVRKGISSLKAALGAALTEGHTVVKLPPFILPIKSCTFAL